VSRVSVAVLSRLASPDAPLHLVLDEHVERAFDDLRELAAGQRMAQELARTLELGEELGARREFDSIAQGRQRQDLRTFLHAGERVAWLGTGFHRTLAGRETGG